MDIQVKELENCKLLVNYIANAEEISQKRDEVLSVFKKAPVPGYRPGKANKNALMFHYKKQIDDALKRAMAEQAFHDTLFEKNIKPHGMPSFKSMLLDGNKFSCEFELLKRPEFDLLEVKGIEVVKPHQKVSEEDLTEKILQDFRVKHSERVQFSENDFVQTGDTITISYEAFIDGEKIDELSTDTEMLTVGQSQMPEFDTNLLGMKPGETREFSVQASASGIEKYKGKTVLFKATLNMGSKLNFHPLDDTLAQKASKNSLTELRDLCRQYATAQISMGSRKALMDSVSAKLVDMHDINVPDFLVKQEAHYLAHTNKVKFDDLEDSTKESLLNIAKKNVKLALVLDKIRDSEPDAQLTDKETIDKIKETLKLTHNNESIDGVLKQWSETGYLQIVFAQIRDEHTLEFVTRHCKIIE